MTFHYQNPPLQNVGYRPVYVSESIKLSLLCWVIWVSTVVLSIVLEKNSRAYISITSDELKSLLIHEKKSWYAHKCLYQVFQYLLNGQKVKNYRVAKLQNCWSHQIYLLLFFRFYVYLLFFWNMYYLLYNNEVLHCTEFIG